MCNDACVLICCSPPLLSPIPSDPLRDWALFLPELVSPSAFMLPVVSYPVSTFLPPYHLSLPSHGLHSLSHTYIYLYMGENMYYSVSVLVWLILLNMIDVSKHFFSGNVMISYS